MYGNKILYEINKQTSDTINIVKILAIFLVCYIHSYRDIINFKGYSIQLEIPIWFDIVQYIISEVIACVAVPLFFFFSSLLTYQKDIIWIKNIKKKINTLLIPYIILNTIGILSYFILQQIPTFSVFFSKPQFIVSNWNCFDWINAYIGYRNGYPLLFPLWFIRNLLILNIFCTFIKFMVKKYNLSLLILLGFVYIFSNNISNNAHLAQLTCGGFFWLLGCYCSINNIKFKDIKYYVEKYNLLLLYLLGCLTCYILHYIDFTLMPINRIVTTIGVFCFISVVYNMKNTNLKNTVLKLTPYIFPIYLFHEFNLSFFRKLLSAILPNTTFFIVLEYILCPLIIIIYCIVLSIILKKISPKLFGIITGGRI